MNNNFGGLILETFFLEDFEEVDFVDLLSFEGGERDFLGVFIFLTSSVCSMT